MHAGALSAVPYLLVFASVSLEASQSICSTDRRLVRRLCPKMFFAIDVRRGRRAIIFALKIQGYSDLVIKISTNCQCI
jgi:hypothetical protein